MNSIAGLHFRRESWSAWFRALSATVLFGLILFAHGRATATTLTKYPSSSSDCVNSTSVGTKVWTSPGNAYSSDANYAVTTVLSSATSNYLKCTNYGFNIPLGATINGITVNVYRKTNRTSSKLVEAAMRVIKGGTVGSVDQLSATAFTTTMQSVSHGSSTQLWGQTWSASDINSTGFGAAYSVKRTSTSSRTVYVDYMSITVDYIAPPPPLVTSIALADFNPRGGSTASWTVTFSGAVSPVVTADFALASTGSISGASVASVTGSGTTWTVVANTGTGSGTLGLNLTDRDTIKDGAGSLLGGNGLNNGNFTGALYTVDKVSPYVDFLPLVGNSTTNASSVQWTVVFTKSVTGVDASDFQLVQGGGLSGASITSITGSGSTYTLTANTGSGSGTLALKLVDNDSIVDSLGNKLGGTGAGNGTVTGPAYTIDKAFPVVSSINLGDASPTNNATVSWDVTFSKSVTGVALSKFSLTGSGTAGASLVSIAGSGTLWTVTADTGICLSTCTLGLNLADDDTIVDAVGNTLGGTGSGNGNFTGQVYSLTQSQPQAGFSFGETWTGSADDVVDSQGLNGTSKNAAQTTTGNCRYGIFYNGGTITKGYIDLPNMGYLSTDFTITSWIRTTDRTVASQRIYIDDSSTDGYALSLGDGGAGKLRFYSYAGGSGIRSVDTSAVISNNTWYFVAAAVDVSNGQVTLYVFDASGNLLTSTSSSFTGWGTDPGNSNDTIGGQSSPTTTANRFMGNLDEVQIWDRVLNQAAIAKVLTQNQSQSCFAGAPDHYELSVPTSSLACLPTTVTVTACANSSSPCNTASTNVNGQTATLASSGGALGTSTPAFNSNGVATTTLSYPAASNSSNVSITLSGEQATATNSRQCCPNGTSCSVANSCTTTFNTAGFIVSATAGGTAATIPAQTAGTSSGTYQLRSVKTGTTSQACEAALVGAQSVNVAYQCNNPTTCYASNLMTVNGSASTSVQRNNNSGVSSYTPVSMTFDANGNAPFTFNYSDAGQVALWFSATAGSATLNGSSNAFVVKPGGFVVSSIKQTALPNLVNPVATGPAGAKFVKAGEAFSATVTATTSTGATAYSYGRETSAEGVVLTHTLVQPVGGATGSLANGTIPGSSFANGVGTASTLTWSEVGIISLNAAVADGDYLGAGNVSGSSSGNVGRFYPDHFDTVVTAGCVPGGSLTSFTYSGQPYTVTITAKNFASAPVSNFSGTSFAKSVVLSDSSIPALLGSITSGSVVAASSFTSGVASASPAFTFTSRWTSPGTMKLRATDTTDLETSATGAEGTALIRSGRLFMANAYGSDLLALPMSLTSQYWNGVGFVLNADDSCTSLTVPTVANGGLVFGSGSLVAGDTVASINSATSGTSALVNGDAHFSLTKPGQGKRGYVDITVSAPAWLNYPWRSSTPTLSTGRGSFGFYKSKLIFRRENY